MSMKLEINLIFSLVFLIALLVTQIFRRPFLGKYAKQAYFVAIGGVALVAGIYSYLQFMAWVSAPPPARYLLPPYQSINYFLFYVFARYWANYILAFLLSLLTLGGARWLNRRYGERFFYPEEPYLIASAIILIGSPLWLFYLISVLAIYCLYILIWVLIMRKNIRVSFYYFWLPIGIAFLLAISWLSTTKWFVLFKI